MLINSITVNVDYNGIVLFEPNRLEKYFKHIPEGENLFEIMTTTNHGEAVLEKGIVLPILAITDGGYDVNIYIDEFKPRNNIVFSNGVFPLKIESKLIIADLAVFREWHYDVDWFDTRVPKGIYSATLRGYCEIKNNTIVDCGYDVCLQPKNELPQFTANMEISNQVMNLV